MFVFETNTSADKIESHQLIESGSIFAVFLRQKLYNLALSLRNRGMNVFISLYIKKELD